MEIRYYKQYSQSLQRDMEFKVYGHAGKPVLFVPCQAGRFWDFEGFKMIDVWAKWIDKGDVTVYSMDTLDGETYANEGGDCAYRTQLHEKWYNYAIDELVPMIRKLSAERNGGREDTLMIFGASLGGMHAANFFFRRPDIFDSVLAMSGLYEPGPYFPKDYMDEALYNNSPALFLRNMPADHHYIGLYNTRKIFIVTGQGAWEDVAIDSTNHLKAALDEKGIKAHIEYWGYDVNHDWPWWYKQCDYYVPQIIY